MIDFENLPKIHGEYKFNESMKRHTWLNAGGNAEVMFLPKDEKDLQYFLQKLDKNIPVFVVGGGSNLLVRDGGIDGIIIKLKNKNFASLKYEDGLLHAGAGLQNGGLKKFLLENKIGGLEFLCSIPGTIGGLIRSNAGCFGKELSDVLVNANVMNRNGDIFKAEPDDFHFSYRHSDFPEDWIILNLSFKAVEGNMAEIQNLINEQAEYRFAHQPQNVRTAGSTFKNPPETSAWKLIKAVGGDTLKIGGASFSPQHCNFLINDGTASAEDIEILGNTVIERVKNQEHINLEWEVKIIGKHKS